MTTAAIEAYCNKLWGTDAARVIGDRICGNRTASAVIDGNGNFMPLTWRPGDGYQPVQGRGRLKHKCESCDGTGEVDSGGFYPQGQLIDIECPDCRGRGAVEIDGDLMDYTVPAENDAADTAQRWREQRGG